MTNCPRCRKPREMINGNPATFCVCGYNFFEPSKSTIHANEKFIFLNTKTSHKRYESMVLYALHYELRNTKILSQFQVPIGETHALIDAYFPDLKLAIEIDEPYHERQQDRDAERQQQIETLLGCEFIRITCNRSIYDQVDEIVKIVREKGPENWEHKHAEPNQRSGEFSSNNWKGLLENNVPELMDTFYTVLKEGGESVRIGSIHGIPSPANGEYGFLLEKSDLTFGIYMRKSRTIRVRVLKVGPSVSKNFVDKELFGRQLDYRLSPRFYAIDESIESYADEREALEAIEQLLEKLQTYP